METKPKHLTKQERRDIQADHGGYPTMETVTGIRDNAARARWPKHAPGPWRTENGWITDETGLPTIARIPGADMPGRGYSGLTKSDHANAARIVQCVNAHDVLVKALTAVMWHLDARLLASPDEHAQEAMDEGHAALEAAKVTP